MKKVAGILCASLAGASVLLWSAASAAGASNPGPRDRRGLDRSAPDYAVAEPASIALLGVGLVILGVYAKRKNGKKT
jgi:hypothetical protein